MDEGVTASSATNYRLASVTKQFTAMAVMQLIEAGKLSFDDTLTTVFPDFPEYGSHITIRHLLNHTSGLRDYEGLIPSGQSEQVHDRDILALYKQQSSGSFTAGSRYRYCNGGYVLLGVIVETASGETFAGYLKKHIFEPLGMKNTVAFEDGISTVPNRAFGYSRQGSGFAKTPPFHTLYACASFEIRSLNCHAAQNPAFLTHSQEGARSVHRVGGLYGLYAPTSSIYTRAWNDPYGLPWWTNQDTRILILVHSLPFNCRTE